VEKENEWDSAKAKQQSVWNTPKHGSRHTACLAQGLQNKFVKRGFSRRPDIIDPVTAANRLDFSEITRQLFLKPTNQIRV
jgi:hypothetical protein